MTKYIVVAGGVISGVGKGVTTAALGKIIKENGYKTTLIKIDPYINCDAGTLRPTEHGEVWVTDDGGEIDQDLGTYERFLDQSIPKKNNITTGQIYKAVIDRERAGGYLGQTVQFVPHITNEVISRIKDAADGYDVAVIEIGGTVGDFENKPFFFAVKALERELGSDNVAYVLVCYLPVPAHIHEMKTKPALQAIRLLNEEGISPDFIVCRSQYAIDEIRKNKIETYAHIPSDHVIAAPDIDTIYQIPLDLERERVGAKMLKKLNLVSKRTPDWSAWQLRVDAIKNPAKRVRIGIVGKYLSTGDYSLTDSYLSIDQALIHAGAQLNVGIDVVWLDAQSVCIPHVTELQSDSSSAKSELQSLDGIIVPGGFGVAGVEGKIAVIQYAREHNIPYLGLCYGMQLAAVEFARNVCGLRDAHTTEVNAQTEHPIIDILPLQKKLIDDNAYGGTMRLGAYAAHVQPGSKVAALYRAARAIDMNDMVIERHRHRYEMNPAYVALLEQHGLRFSGRYLRADATQLMEFLELPDHPFFVATQAHPEFNSRFSNPNPLFYGFVKAAIVSKQE
ncbi:MAG TPA: CTP synthase [Candidatus Babeliales bacterium]|nr:CTP synthase [Candidatus Babeliales bacterium]